MKGIVTKTQTYTRGFQNAKLLINIIANNFTQSNLTTIIALYIFFQP